MQQKSSTFAIQNKKIIHMNSYLIPSIPCFVFYKDLLLLKKEDNNNYSIPCGKDLPFYVGQYHIHQVTLPSGSSVQTLAIENNIEDTSEWMMCGLRSSFNYLSLNDYQAAGKSYQILYWDKHSHFCPACGTVTEQHTSIMKKCPNCGYEIYPPISPAIIVLVQRKDEVLLVHAHNFKGTFYGLVAGFLEAGETLEQCVQREVFEETGLKIKNITYFSSQPWPYPSGLMIGFTAEYESGEIKLQADELSAGAFYSKDNLPELPQKLSIARKLIDWWLSKK